MNALLELERIERALETAAEVGRPLSRVERDSLCEALWSAYDEFCAETGYEPSLHGGDPPAGVSTSDIERFAAAQVELDC